MFISHEMKNFIKNYLIKPEEIRIYCFITNSKKIRIKSIENIFDEDINLLIIIRCRIAHWKKKSSWQNQKFGLK